MIKKLLTIDELPMTYGPGKSFLEEAGYPAPFNSDAFFNFWSAMITANRSEIWAAIEGTPLNPSRIVGAIAYSFMTCPLTGDFTALEQFFWVDREYRRKGLGLELWDDFEKRAKQRGAKRIMMVHLASLNLQAAYERRGYRLLEQAFWKNI